MPSFDAREASCLPKPPARLVHAIDEALHAITETRRRNSKKARLLALIVQLHDAGRPFPIHRVAAEHVGCTIDNVRAQLADSIDRHLIRQKIEAVSGNVQSRPSVVRRHLYVPTTKLMNAIERNMKPRNSNSKLQPVDA